MKHKHKGKGVKSALKNIIKNPMEPKTKITIMGDGDPEEMLKELPDILKTVKPMMAKIPEIGLDDLKKKKKKS